MSAAGDAAPGAADWAALPAACVVRALSLLPGPHAARGAAAAACVCSSWRAAAADARVWAHVAAAERSPRGGVRAASALGAPADAADASSDEDEGDASCDWRTVTREARAARDAFLAGTPARSRALVGHTDFVRCVAVRGDAVLSAASSTRMRDCSLRLWSASSGACSARLTGHGGPIWSLAWRGGSAPAVTGSGDGTVRLWDVCAPESAPLVLQLGGGEVRSVATDARSAVVAAGSEARVARVAAWHVRRRSDDGGGDDEDTHRRSAFEAEQALSLRCDGSAALQLSRCGRIMAWASPGGVVGVARVPSPDGAEEAGNARTVPTPNLIDSGAYAVSTMSFDDVTAGPLADGIVVGTTDGITILPGALARGGAFTPRQLSRGPGHRAAVMCLQQGVAGSPALVAAGSTDGAVQLLDTRAIPTLVPWHADADARVAGSSVLCLHARGYALATGSADGSARVYDLRMAGPVTAFAADGGHRLLHTASVVGNGTTATRHRDRLWALHAGRRRLVTAGLDGQLLVHDWL